MTVDPCFADLLADPRNELRRPPAHVPMEKFRAAANAFLVRFAGSAAAVATEDVRVAGPDGHALALRIYRAAPGHALPGIVFCHGGGFVFGDLDTHDAMCRALAVQSRCAVIAVDYRLAPEFPFPAALEDCMMAVRALREQPRRFGLSDAELALAGDSAGGHIAIAAALAARQAQIPIRHVILFYPAVDADCSSSSMHEFGTGHLLTREGMQWFWNCYAPAPATRKDPLIKVLTADLRNFPATTLITGEADPLRDEGELFAERLQGAGVSVHTHRFSGMIHGFAGMSLLTPQATRAIELAGRSL